MSANRFLLTIVVPNKTYFNEEVESISVVTQLGALTILAHHTDLIANVEISHLTIHQNGHILNYAVAGGILNIYQNENKVLLCVNAIESADEINLERAIAAKENAEKKLQEENISVREQMKAEIKLKRSLNRISLKKQISK